MFVSPTFIHIIQFDILFAYTAVKKLSTLRYAGNPKPRQDIHQNDERTSNKQCFQCKQIYLMYLLSKFHGAVDNLLQFAGHLPNQSLGSGKWSCLFEVFHRKHVTVVIIHRVKNSANKHATNVSVPTVYSHFYSIHTFNLSLPSCLVGRCLRPTADNCGCARKDMIWIQS